MAERLHEFQRSCQVEDRWAPVLDAWLGQRYRLRPATTGEQWLGMDRMVIADDGMVGIDYKCDERAQQIGNAFIELVSNDVSGRWGWGLTSEADWILYFVVPGQVLAFLAAHLRDALPAWLQQFPVRRAHNGRYRTLGICVPLDEARRVAEYVAHLDRGDGPVLMPRCEELPG